MNKGSGGMGKELFIGIDIGTSGIRAALFDINGVQLHLEYREYPLICTMNGMGELDPELVFRSFLEVVRNCITNSGANNADIQALSFSTQLFSIMVVDSKGRAMTNVLTWIDTRCSGQADSIFKNHDYYSAYQKTGCRIQHPMYPVSKILWLRENYPGLFKGDYKYVSIKEYILFRLFSEFVIDITDASTTGCFNIHRFKWDEDIICDVLNETVDHFGETVDCTYILRNMKLEYSDYMGIHQSTPIVVGSGDGMLANLGCGVFDDTSMSSTVGTSGALRIAVSRPFLDEKQRTWCYCFTRDTWVAGAAINNGGIVLKWIRDEYLNQFQHEMKEKGAESVYKLFDMYSEEVAPGSEGLLFLPFLTGERAPNWNANTRGTLHGLTLHHGKKHIIRAAMESVMFRLYSIYEIITEAHGHINQIYANGGYTNSKSWLRMQADIFNREIAVSGIQEAAAFGAAYIAMYAIGVLPDLKQMLPGMKPQGYISPISSNVEVYKSMYLQFIELYKKLYT